MVFFSRPLLFLLFKHLAHSPDSFDINSHTFHSDTPSKYNMAAPTRKRIIISLAELASMRVNFSVYMQSYLGKKGIDAAFLKENITAEKILMHFIDASRNLLKPAKAKPRSLADRGEDEVTTDHLQRYFRAEHMPEVFVERITGPHVVDYVLSSLPQKLRQQYYDSQAKKSDSSAEGAAKSGQRESALDATTSSKKRKRPDPSDDDYDDDEDLSQGHRSMKKSQKSQPKRKRTSKSLKSKSTATEEPLLDLSVSHNKISTPCLKNLTLSQNSPFKAQISAPKFLSFLATSATFQAARLASVCVTLARAGQKEKAKAFGQYGLDLLGPALFDAHVVVCEKSAEEKDGMFFSKLVLVDCVDELHYGCSKPAAARLRHLINEEGMWWSKPKGS